MDTIANALLEREILEGKELDELLGNCEPSDEQDGEEKKDEVEKKDEAVADESSAEPPRPRNAAEAESSAAE